MNYQEKLLAYYIEIGLSKDFLRHVCITSADAKYLSQRVKEVKPRNILEVGTFIGLSTGVIAMSAAPESKLVCVDLNLPIKAHLLVGSGNFKISDQTPTLTHVERMLQHFQLSNPVTFITGFFSSRLNGTIMSRLLSDYPEVEKIRIISDDIAKYGQFDFVFIDGDHSETGVSSDLELAQQYLTPGGEILLHDVNGNWSLGVNAGIKNFLDKHQEFSLNEIKSGIGRITKRIKQ